MCSHWQSNLGSTRDNHWHVLSFDDRLGSFMIDVDLIIFDCDGVLVDSELIFARVLAESLVALDFPTTVDEALALGFGKNRVTLGAAVESRFGRPLSDEFFETMRARTALVLERELQPIPGIEELLNALALPRCVASNGHLERVRERLTLTRLLRFFRPACL